MISLIKINISSSYKHCKYMNYIYLFFSIGTRALLSMGQPDLVQGKPVYFKNRECRVKITGK